MNFWPLGWLGLKEMKGSPFREEIFLQNSKKNGLNFMCDRRAAGEKEKKEEEDEKKGRAVDNHFMGVGNT